MNKYLISICMCIALLILLPGYAAADDIPASECPAVSAIIATGLKDAECDAKYPTIWTVVNAGDHFGTQNNWSFELEYISAQTLAEAVAKGNVALKTLTFTGVDMFFCLYAGEYDGEEVTGRAMKLPR